jgi:hypothetical protein
MKATKLARRIGLDRNPLRRRTDRAGTCLAVLLAVVFLAGAPLLSAAAASWAARTAAAGQRAERSWHQVSAVLLTTTTASGSIDGFGGGSSWGFARWTAPGGQIRTGEIPVKITIAAGQAVPLWVDQAGWPTGPPLSHGAIATREVAAAVVAALALGLLLLCLGALARWMLDRRRHADWEAAWSIVGPLWTERFRSRGQP